MAELKEIPHVSEVIKLEGFMADQFRTAEGEAPLIPVGERFELNSPGNITRVLETYQGEPKDYFYFKASTIKGNYFLSSDGEKTKFFEKEKEAKTFSKMDERVDAFYKMKEIREAADAEKNPANHGDLAELRAELAASKQEKDELREDVKKSLDALKKTDAAFKKSQEENASLKSDLQEAIAALKSK